MCPLTWPTGARMNYYNFILILLYYNMSTFSLFPIDKYMSEDLVPLYERGDTSYDFRNPHFVSAGDFTEGI